MVDIEIITVPGVRNGLRNAVLFPQSDDNGKLLENKVFLQLHRNLKPFEKIFYFLNSSAECDFVIQRNESISDLIQVCWDMSDENTQKRAVDGLLAASKATGCTHLSIITLEQEYRIRQDQTEINVLPIWKWLLGR